MEPDELEARLSAAERDASAALVLARAVDRDVAEIRDFRRAVVRSFNALRAEMNERFASIDGRLVSVEQRFDDVDRRFAEVGLEFAKVDGGFTEMRGKFDLMAIGQRQIVGLLETLIADQGKHPD